MHQSDAYSSTSYSRGIRWLPSPEVCRMRSACTYVLIDFALYRPLLYPLFLLTKPHSMQLNPFPKQTPIFTCLQYKSFENTVGKGEIARTEHFLLFPQCFLLVWITLSQFYYNLKCRLQTQRLE